MKIQPTKQPLAPPGRPDITRPVLVGMDVPLYYLQTAGHPVLWEHDIFCSDDFAAHVLVLLNHWAKKHAFAVVHLGVYNARKARHKDGTPIVPARWSNHAYGEAMDFAGIIPALGQGKFMTIEEMQDGCPAKLNDLSHLVRSAILGEGRQPEIVDEGGWIHLGMFPAHHQ